jgi:hypothetical protein
MFEICMRLRKMSPILKCACMQEIRGRKFAKFAYAVVKKLPVRNLPALRKESWPGPTQPSTASHTNTAYQYGEARSMDLKRIKVRYLDK